MGRLGDQPAGVVGRRATGGPSKTAGGQQCP